LSFDIFHLSFLGVPDGVDYEHSVYDHSKRSSVVSRIFRLK